MLARHLPCGALAIALVSVACGAPPPAVIRTQSVPKPPTWMVKPPSEGGALYFSGTRSGADTLEDGKQAALDKARAEAAKFIGVSVSAEHLDVMSSDLASDQIKETTQSRTVALIKNAALVDVYWEKFSRQAGATSIDKYDVSVLIKLSKADLQAERDRQEAEGKAAVSQGVVRLREGEAKEKDGDYIAALIRYREVVNSLKPMAVNIDSGDAVWKNSGAVRQAAEEALSKATKKARRAVLIGPDWVVGPITQGLSKSGFSASARDGITEPEAVRAAKAEGIPWVIVARATNTPGGNVFQQVAATASLDVRALESNTGETAASIQKSAKGIGRTAEAAKAAAATEAGVGAGTDLATALKEKENAAL